MPNWNGFQIQASDIPGSQFDPALSQFNVGCSCGLPKINGKCSICDINEETKESPLYVTAASKEMELVDHLKKCLGETAVLYHMAHGFHWNVKGPDFQEYHILFETIYSDIYDAIDPMAENIVKLGYVAPFSLKTFIELSDIKEVGDLRAEPQGLAKTLQSKNAQIIKSLKECFTKANKDNEQGIANFIAERIDAHQKWDWFLKASLGM